MNNRADQLKIIQSANDGEFLTWARFVRQEDIDSVTQHAINNRLERLGLELEYGCCGTNHLRNKERKKLV